MPDKSLTIEQVLAMLAESEPKIAAHTAGLTPAELRTPLNQGEWSANEVLAHLRSCADVGGNCIAAILAEDRPTIRAVSPITWIKSTDYLELEFRPSLRSFATQRSDLLAFLEPLPPEAWSRTATVKRSGKVLERTMMSYAQWLALHERVHITEIERIAVALRG